MALPGRSFLLVAALALVPACVNAFAPSGVLLSVSQRAHLSRSSRAHFAAQPFLAPRVGNAPVFRKNGLALRMQGDEFSTVKVKSNTEAGEGLRSIMVEVGKDIAGSYKTPGMFVKIRKDSSMEKPGFFAVASAPGAGNTFEFLIKKTDGSAWIADAKEGSKVDMTVAQGKGYKYAEAFNDVNQVVLLATGSGIAPLKAVVESGDLKKCSPTLYYGCRSEKTMAFQDKFKEWKSMGVTVVPVLSQPEDGWKGRKGYVQDCLKEDGVSDASKTGALLCGVNDMVKQAKEVLKEEGVSEDMMLMNF